MALENERFPRIQPVDKLKGMWGIPWNANSIFFTPLSLLSCFLSLPLTLQTPQRTHRHKLNALFQRDNLHSAEERVCKIPSHSVSPWGDTNSLFSSTPLLSLTFWMDCDDGSSCLHTEFCLTEKKDADTWQVATLCLPNTSRKGGRT